MTFPEKLELAIELALHKCLIIHPGLASGFVAGDDAEHFPRGHDCVSQGEPTIEGAVTAFIARKRADLEHAAATAESEAAKARSRADALRTQAARIREVT